MTWGVKMMRKRFYCISINSQNKEKTAVSDSPEIQTLGKDDFEADFIFLLSAPRGSNSKKKILMALAQGPKSCNQLAKVLRLNWRTVYRHLQILEQKALVLTFSFGERKFYKLSLKGCKVTDRLIVNTKNEKDLLFDH